MLTILSWSTIACSNHHIISSTWKMYSKCKKLWPWPPWGSQFLPYKLFTLCTCIIFTLICRMPCFDFMHSIMVSDGGTVGTEVSEEYDRSFTAKSASCLQSRRIPGHGSAGHHHNWSCTSWEGTLQSQYWWSWGSCTAIVLPWYTCGQSSGVSGSCLQVFLYTKTVNLV